MIVRGRHLSDDRLVELCLGMADSGPDREHVEACADCEARRVSLTDLLSDTADVAAAEADAFFSPDRLTRQRTRILQRLEQEGAPGRVISFPAAQMQVRPQRGARPGTRWIASAAAAGLLIGILAGHFAHVLPAGTGRASSTMVGSPAALQTISTTAADEEFLWRLETALEGTTGVLRPLDDLTPRVWEVAAQ